MIEPELSDKLLQAFETCAIHLKRMEFARSKVEAIIPLTREKYSRMDEEKISFLDQFIFRFSKLQDIMGGRLFPLTLEALAEPVSDKAFIDILNRLEKLGILDSAHSWVQLRRIRNEITHEYPASILEKIEGINMLFDSVEGINIIIERCRSLLNKHN